MRDLRYALRTLLRSPGFTLTVILTLSLGIGASTAVFSALDRLLLRTLPYPQPDRLVALHETQTGKQFRPVSLPNLLDWRAQTKSFEGVAGFMTRSFGLREGGGPVNVIMTGMVTSDLFRVLGREPHLGRTFSEREESQGDPVIVITDDLWARQFHRDSELLGRTVQLNEQPYQVIGILPVGFAFPAPATQVDAYIPISHRDYGSRGAKPLQAVARLRPGVSLATARAELQALGTNLASKWPDDNPRGGADLESLDDAWKGNLRRPVLLLTIAALLLLAIVCTNVVNLILARSLARSPEMDIRRALGAGRRHLAGQMLAESLLLSLAGGTLGILLAKALLRALPIILGQQIASLSLDGRALFFTAAVSLLVTVLCGVAPALSSGPSRRPVYLRQALVIGQIALSLVLLLSAGAFLRVFLKLVNRNPGFETAQVYYFGFGLPEGRYSERQMLDFHATLRRRLTEIPGVESAGAVSRLPLNGRSLSTAFQFEGAGMASAEWPAVALNMVDPAYFSVLRIPLLSGRSLAWDTDGLGRPPVVMVNRAFEKVYAASGSIVGRRVQLRFWTDLAPKNQLWEIAGVVGDTYQAGLDQSIRPQLYLPVSQTGLDGGAYLIRTARTDPGLSAAVAEAVRSVDPDSERINLRRLVNWVSQSLGDRRMPAILTGIFAAIGLALTALGLYGTMALEVGRRRKEIAIRVALGATRTSVTALVLARGLILTIAGTVAGMLAFTLVGKALSSQLYEVSPTDPMNAVTVVAILFACAICACLRPAWNALRQQPVAVLREM